MEDSSEAPVANGPVPNGVPRGGGGGGGVGLQNPQHLHEPSPPKSLRRCSILGPPSLFPLQQQLQSADGTGGGGGGGGGAGGGGGGVGVAGAAGGRRDSGFSAFRKVHQHPTSATGSDAGHRFDAEEVAVTIADLDFYYGLGEVFLVCSLVAVSLLLLPN